MASQNLMVCCDCHLYPHDACVLCVYVCVCVCVYVLKNALSLNCFGRSKIKLQRNRYVCMCVCVSFVRGIVTLHLLLSTGYGHCQKLQY